MKAVILAAGKGTRLAPFNKLLPKPLMPIGKKNDGSFKTIIERLIEQLEKAMPDEIIVVVNYKADLIKEYLGIKSETGQKIRYVEQEVLDGNAGAFYRAQRFVEGDVIITDADNLIEGDQVFKRMYASHRESNADITIAVCRVHDIRKYAIVKVENGKAVDIFEKPTDENKWGNLAKSGALILSKGLSQMDKQVSEVKGEYTTTQIIKYAIENGMEINLFPIRFNDIGTWGEYTRIFKESL